MANRKLKIVIGVLGLFILAATESPAQQRDVYHVLRTVALGGDGSWDYLRFDPDSGRLFVARSTRVMVVDVHAGKLIGEIPGTAGVHGVALISDLHRGVTSNGKANTATIFSLETLKPLGLDPLVVHDLVRRKVITDFDVLTRRCFEEPLAGGPG